MSEAVTGCELAIRAKKPGGDKLWGGSESGIALRIPGCSGPEQAFSPQAGIAGCPLPHFFRLCLISFVFLPGSLPDPIPSFPKPALPLSTSLSSHTFTCLLCLGGPLLASLVETSLVEAWGQRHVLCAWLPTHVAN